MKIRNLDKRRIDQLFSQYVSREIKNKIISAKKDIIGEKKKVVILFSDIRSFSTFSEKISPEELVIHLNAYFSLMVDCINSKGGIIDKFIGDAIVAVFGGLQNLEAPADAALEAALKMQKSIPALNQKWQNNSNIKFNTGIGLHYGDWRRGKHGLQARKPYQGI